MLSVCATAVDTAHTTLEKDILTMVLDDNERLWIDKYGFTVTTNNWGEYILVDPQLPKGKNRFHGGNLHSLMIKAISARSMSAAKSPPKAVRRIVSKVSHNLKHGKLFEIKKMIIEDESITVKDVLAKLQSMGMPSTPSVVTTTRSELLDSLRLLRELNVLR
jgi:hypothetical protein